MAFFLKKGNRKQDLILLGYGEGIHAYSLANVVRPENTFTGRFKMLFELRSLPVKWRETSYEKIQASASKTKGTVTFHYFSLFALTYKRRIQQRF